MIEILFGADARRGPKTTTLEGFKFGTFIDRFLSDGAASMAGSERVKASCLRFLCVSRGTVRRRQADSRPVFAIPHYRTSVSRSVDPPLSAAPSANVKWRQEPRPSLLVISRLGANSE